MIVDETERLERTLICLERIVKLTEEICQQHGIEITYISHRCDGQTLTVGFNKAYKDILCKTSILQYIHADEINNIWQLDWLVHDNVFIKDGVSNGTSLKDTPIVYDDILDLITKIKNPK